MHAANGWCDSHNQQQRKGLPMHALAPISDPAERCQAPDCAERAVRQGYCAKHYFRWRNTGAVDGFRPTPSATITAVDADARILTPRPGDTPLPVPPAPAADESLNAWARRVNIDWHARWERLDAASAALLDGASITVDGRGARSVRQ